MIKEVESDVMPEPLKLWSIYDHPEEYPRHFVVRQFEITATGTRSLTRVMIADDLPEARRLLPQGLRKLAPRWGDDPMVVEMWM